MGAENRVLVLTPSGRDAPLAAQVLAREQIEALVCGEAAELIGWMAAGAMPKPHVAPVGAVRISLRIGMSTWFAGCGPVS